MEIGPGEWKNYSNGKGTEWQWGSPENVGPNSTHSGLYAWGTNIASNYTDESVAYLESPHFDLALSTNTYLGFWFYMITENFSSHNWDGGLIEISTDGGGNWVQIDDPVLLNPDPYYDAVLRDATGNAFGGQMAYCYDRIDWTEVSVDLSKYDGSSSLKFRFAFGSDIVGNAPGWYIDDVVLSADVREGILVEPDYSTINLDGTTQQYNLTIRNLQTISEIVDLTFSDNLGWPVGLLQSDGVSPLVDSGGLPGIPDSGMLSPGSTFDFIAEVTVPAGTPHATQDVVRIEGIPFFGSVSTDVACIRVSTPSPDVEITDLVVPITQVAGDLANVTANLTNLGQFPRSFDVRLDIYGPGPVSYNPLSSVVNLGADETDNVRWTFTPTVPGYYTLTAMTMLADDTVPENNVSTEKMGVFTTLFADDMELGGSASQGQWTPEIRPQNAWELGTPTLIGPTECHSLTECWGTNLNSEYNKGADIRLETPPINLSNAEEVRLRFWHFYDIYGPFRNDGGFVEISADGGLSWVHIKPYGGYPGSLDLTAPTPPGGGAGAYAGSSLDWLQADFDLSSFVGEEIKVGFHLWTDNSNYQSGWAGWYIDDFQILHVPVGSILIFTEIQDGGPGGERIEIYNAGKESDNLNNYSVIRATDNTTIGGTWSVAQVNPGQYSYFSTTGTELDDDGELLNLINTTSDWIEDKVGYGQKGVVPDPISGESSARFWNGTAYEDYWTRSPVTSFGFSNIVPPWDNQTEVVLNEVLFNPQLVGDEFVEIYYTGNSSINLRGFIIVCDNAYIVSTDVILNVFANHYILLPLVYPGLFAEMDIAGENLYIYNSTGSYLDMVGWSSDHDVGKSMARIPEGFGSHDGYDDWSSYQAGWRFGKEPTMALLSLWPDQIGYGDLGENLSYNLTLLNQPSDDLISFTYDSTSPWQIDFLMTDWSPITDTNLDGLLDAGVVPASSFYNFTVNVTIPTQPPVGTEMIAEIYANSTINKGKDLAIIITRTYPHLEPMKRADPEEIYLEGVGTNEVSRIELEVFGGGYLITERHPQDTVFIIDGSQSMDTNDPLNLRLEAAKKYVNNMTVPDRGAVVEFADAANLVPAPIGDHLSSDYAKIRQNIDTIGANGGTNISEGLRVANSELINYGNSSHLWVEILLTDGHEVSSNYPITSQRIQEAADAGIIIFTIGLGIGVNETLLQEIADRTGGRYYFAQDAEALEDIYSMIGLLVFDVAGKDTNVTDANPMIRDVVPAHIHVDYGSFTDFPDAIYNNTDGTVFEWNVSEVMVSESWEASYEVTCSILGWVPVGVYPKARVSYVNWNNENSSMPFPHTTIHVILPPPSPPRNLRASVETSVDIRLDWDPPEAANVSYYLIYRANDQREFDFTNPIHNTSTDASPSSTNWTDAGATGPGAPKEYYYTVRVVDSTGSKSRTSNTAGKWTKSFRTGRDSFSLPLEPHSSLNVSQLALDIPNAEFIRWMGTDGRWVTHVPGMGQGVNDRVASLGEGFEISLLSDTNYTFVGLPGSMISYSEGYGEAVLFRKGLVVDVQGTNISLSWQPLAGASAYEVYRSTKRDGLFEEPLQPIKTVPAGFTNHTDLGVALPGQQFYYWIIPIDSIGERGSSTYSVGVWIQGYQKGTDTFSLPLKPLMETWIDDYCEMSANIAGIMHMMSGYWRLHAREMPSLVYDAVVGQGTGYQISTEGATQIIFIGY